MYFLKKSIIVSLDIPVSTQNKIAFNYKSKNNDFITND